MRKIHQFRFPFLPILLTALLTACTALYPGPVQCLERHLVVIHTNDTHGHPLKFCFNRFENAGGLPARATLINSIRKKNKNVLVLDAGDINTGGAVSGLFNAEPDIIGYNHIGYDAVTLGNHEFDNPLAVLKQQMSRAEFPFLSANIVTKSGHHLARSYVIKHFDGFDAAVFGLTTASTKWSANPRHTRDLVFLDEVETAKALVPKLRKMADIVIALVHLGIYDSDGYGSRRLARGVDGIDLIVDGHTHTRLEAPVFVKHRVSGRETPIVQAWKWGVVLGRTDLRFQDDRVLDCALKIIPVNMPGVLNGKTGEIPEDEELLNLLRPYDKKVAAWLEMPAGHAEEALPYGSSRHEQTAIGRLVANSMSWFTKESGVDFAVQNGGGIRSSLPEGEITRRDIYEVLPFDNTVIVLTLEGDDVRDLLDYMGSIKRGSGAFPQISDGLQGRLRSRSRRFDGIRIKGRPFNRKRLYRIATNSYLADGGNGYDAFLKATGRHDTAVLQRDVLIKYIESLGGTLPLRHP